MKNRIQLYIPLVILLMFAFLVSSCDSLNFEIGIVEFDEPQPQHKKTTQTFKKNWQGKYYAIHEPDEGIMINENGIVDINLEWKKIHKNHLFAEFQYTGDLEDNKQIKTWLTRKHQTANIQGDSIQLVSWSVDEDQFRYAKAPLLKYYKGQYYVNIKEEDKWVVFQLSYIEGDTLKLGTVFENETLEEI